MTEAAKKTLRQPTITVNHFIPFRFFFFLIQLINFHMSSANSVDLQSQTICTTVVVSDWCIKIQNCKKNNYFIANGFKKN